MKIQILADVHLEFLNDRPTDSSRAILQRINVTPAEVTVIAGDLYTKGRSVRKIAELFPPERPVVFVAGNHDHFGGAYLHNLERMAAMPPEWQLNALIRKSRKRCTHPCNCGFLGDSLRECNCTPPMLQRYRKRLSGPLLDRIDLHVEVPRVPHRDLADPRDAEPRPPSAPGSRPPAPSPT